MNNVMLEIGNIKIYYYSVFILIAIIIGITFCLKEARKYKFGLKKFNWTPCQQCHSLYAALS